MFRMLPQLSPLESSLPYLKVFQWGTVWLYAKGASEAWQVKVESSTFIKWI